jgi:hypothetical protein
MLKLFLRQLFCWHEWQKGERFEKKGILYYNYKCPHCKATMKMRTNEKFIDLR